MTDVTEAAARASAASSRTPGLTQQQCSMLVVLEDYSSTADLLLTLLRPQQHQKAAKWHDEQLHEK